MGKAEEQRETPRKGAKGTDCLLVSFLKMFSPRLHRGSERWGDRSRLLSWQVSGGVPPRLPNVPAIAEQPGTDPREGEQDRQGSQETRRCRRTHAEGGLGDPRQEVTRAGAEPWPGDPGEAVPELQEHFISDPVPSSLFLCFLFSPVWQGVCAVSCPRNRQPVLSGPQQNRPSPLLPPSCLLPQHLPCSLQGKFVFFR